MADRAPDKRLTITITPATGVRSIQLRLSRATLLLGVAGVVLCIVLGAGGLVIVGGFADQARELARLRAGNEQLRIELGRVEELESQVRRLEGLRSSILDIAGIIDPDSSSGPVPGDGSGAEFHARNYTQAIPDTLATEEEYVEMRMQVDTLPLRGPLTRRFGPLDRARGFHPGVDISGDTGTRVRSGGAGVVSFVGNDETFGLVVVVSHSARVETVYGHNSEVLVRVGDFVTSGEEISEVGNTGRSSAPHLHFEVHWDGRAVDPVEVIPSLGVH